MFQWGCRQGTAFSFVLCVDTFLHADVQDDQVVEAVSRDKKRELPLDQILTLTEETFHSAMLEAAQTVVLFYASCEYDNAHAAHYTFHECGYPHL